MSRTWSFLLGAVFGATVLSLIMHLHVVRSSDGLDLIVKTPPRLSETFVDVRAFSVSDWTSRPLPATALVRADKQHLIGDSATSGFQEKAMAIQQKVNELLPESIRK